MHNPGSNLLAIALRYVTPSQVQRLPYLTRTLTPDGKYVASWGPAVPVLGSMQPLERKAIAEQGLDLTRDYAYLYSTTNALDIQPGGASDRVIYNGGTWDLVGKTNWFGEDGWMRVLCVRIP